eukprot:PhF_6_TR11041/c0_g1_i1/m.17915/K13806/DAGL; sn1-specific diacylglycerol lipase
MSIVESSQPKEGQQTTTAAITTNPSTTKVALGIVKDSIGVAGFVADVALRTAAVGVRTGGTIVQTCLPLIPSERCAVVASHLTSAVCGTVDVALTVSRSVTTVTVGAVRGVLDQCGVEDGHSIRAVGSLLTDDTELTEAITAVVNMVCTNVSPPLNPVSVFCTLMKISKLQSEEGSAMERFPQAPTGEDAVQAKYYVPHAFCPMGAITLKFSDMLPLLDTNPNHVEAVCSGSEVMVTQDTSDLYKPAFIVMVDHIAQSVVVSIRATMNGKDVLTDLICESVPYTFPLGSGFVHDGFLRSALNVSATLKPSVTELLLQKYPGYKLVLCGYSLGAGVASVLGQLWLNDFRDIRVYAYAPPCSVSLDLAQKSAFITAITLGDDVVARFGLSHVRDIRTLLHHHNNNHEGLDGYTSMNELRAMMAETKLYPAGTIRQVGRNGCWYDTPTEHFGEMRFSREMLSSHLPNNFWAALRVVE